MRLESGQRSSRAGPLQKIGTRPCKKYHFCHSQKMKQQNVAFSGIASVARGAVTRTGRPEISRADIATALSRVSSGETFRNAPQLVSFLSFVVAKTLVGQEHAIKGYTI